MDRLSFSQKLILFLGCLLEVGFAYFAFYFEGQSIESLNGHGGHELNKESYLLLLLVPFVTFKLFSFFSNNIFNFLQDSWAIRYQKSLHKYLPSVILENFVERKEEIFFTLTRRLPKLFSMQCLKVLNSSLFTISLLLTFMVFLKSHFYWGFAFVLFTLLAVLISQLVWNSQFSDEISKNEKKKDSFGQWFFDYFSGGNQISNIWHSQKNEWIYQRFSALAESERQLLKSRTFKNLMSHFLLELPYLLCFSFSVYFASKRIISMTEVFIFMGLSQYLIRSSIGLVQNIQIGRERIALEEKSSVIFEFIKLSLKERVAKEKTDISSTWKFEISKDCDVEIHTNRRINFWFSKNGTGKSTLLRVLSGLQTKPDFWNSQNLKAPFSPRESYYLNPSPPVFSDLHGFATQIGGPGCENPESALVSRLEECLPLQIKEKWVHLYKSLRNKYPKSSCQKYSEGEKTLISWFRLWLNFSTNHKWLLLDEVDVNLDDEKTQLISESILALSAKYYIVIISHRPKIHHLLRNSGYVSSHFLACDQGQKNGYCFPYWIKYSFSEEGFSLGTEGLGNLGTESLPLLRFVRNILSRKGGKYSLLDKLNLTLFCSEEGFELTEIDSAALSLSISLENILRSINHEAPVTVLGSGSMDIDGYFYGVFGEKSKKRASQTLGLPVITSREISSIDHLDSFDELSFLKESKTL